MSKNTITKLWPIYIGEFINPEHSEIKSGLIDFFEKYKEKNLNNRKGGSTYSSDENLYMGGYDLHLQKDKYVACVQAGYPKFLRLFTFWRMGQKTL